MTKEIFENIPNGLKKSYFLQDCGAYIIPYLRYNLYTFNRVNVTPFIKILENYFQLTTRSRKYHNLFFIDNGVPEKIESMYSSYKGNRKHSKHKNESRIVSRDILSSNEYVVNRTLITQFFTMMGEGVFYFSEADYQLGYCLKKMISDYNIDGSNCYVISHDKDLMALIAHSNCIRRLIQSKEKYTKFWFFPKGSYDAYFEKDLPIYSYEEFIIKKALEGDRIDNILAPIMVTESFVNKLFKEYKFNYGYYNLDMEKAFEIIKDRLINKKIKKSDSSENKALIENRLAFEFRRNYLIFDVYNSDELFKPVDKKYMDVVLENLLTNHVKRDYNSAMDLLKRVSYSYANIFKNWLNDMIKQHSNNNTND